MTALADRRERRRRRRVAGELLRACAVAEARLDPDDIDRLRATVPDLTLLALARYHGVAGRLYESMKDLPDGPAELITALAEDQEAAVRWHLRALWQLDRLGTTLDAAGIRWVSVKGPVLVDMLYGALGRRRYNDLDLLVHPSDFALSLEVLQASGSVLLDRNWPLLRRDRRAQVHLASPSGIELDLHWDLVNVHRRRMAMDTDAILGRRTVVDLGGLRVPTLDPSDTVIHLAVHAAVSGGDRLVWVKDIERAIAVRRPDWREVVERARAWHVAGAVGLMLERARRILAADVPPEVPLALIGRQRIRIVRLIDDLDPLQASPGGPTPGRVMARAIGHGAIDGAIVMALRLMRHFDPREPARSSPFTSAGDVRDREAYLLAVTEAGDRRS